MDISFFKNRRTVRSYSNREVTDALLTEMLEAASQAPTTGNMQLYSVIVTRSEEGKKALAPQHFNQPQATQCGVLLTFCADFNRFVEWCEASDAVPGYDNFQSFITAVLDTAIFAQQFCTIAEMNGLGCCYLGTTTYTAPQIAEILKLPARVVPLVTLSVGYPEGEATLSDRIPVSAIMHEEYYHDYTPERIHQIYAPKEAREDSRRFVTENGKKTLAQVFTDVRYTRENNDLFSRLYLDFIVNQGFKLPEQAPTEQIDN
ncbi:MAG: nitroreductase family protein [Firmicutes bacterium]|nr:nitroreductase family protein [Bacillota bacterium]MCM1401254.1 nitroreductase family protein [Bacteroides sp.]MCM1477197.1 nitroreductase family protein [Bacteroides sp.]